jgi:hypothetical protein
MPRSGAIFVEREPVVAAAVIAAQATLGVAGFRQRDVRFFIEVFSNWLESTTHEWVFNVHNTQVQRSLDLHVSAGWARRSTRKPPRYRLTPEGLLELLQRLVHRRNLTRLDEFFLVYHILDAYNGRLKALVGQSGLLPSRRIALDVDELLDLHKLVARERALVGRAVEQLSVRADESRQTSELTRTLLRQGRDLPKAIAAVQERFPYALNSRKPLSELLGELPEPWRRAELEDAPWRRARGLWEPTAELLRAYDLILSKLPDANETETRERRGHPS